MKEKLNPRNLLLITIGLNTALRISDIIKLQWQDVYSEDKAAFNRHLSVIEQKTGKKSCIYLNQSVESVLKYYKNLLESERLYQIDGFLFASRKGGHISRIQAYRIIRDAAQSCNLTGVISPHSLRKTFGYHAWRNGVKPVLLMDIYNHSSFSVTQRYLGIEQDDRDEVFREMCI